MENGLELRKGNKVAVSSRYFTIKEVFEKTALVELTPGETVFFSFDKIAPIPLTTKMLIEQLKFAKLFDENSSTYINEFFIIDQGDGRFLSVPNSEPIYYLHQLQNLYLKLTKKELQINL